MKHDWVELGDSNSAFSRYINLPQVGKTHSTTNKRIGLLQFSGIVGYYRVQRILYIQGLQEHQSRRLIA
jgi:hypothetical protein